MTATPTTTSRLRAWLVSSVILALLAVAGVAILVPRGGAEPAVAAERATTPPEDVLQADPTTGTRVAYLGDSYTVGTGARSAEAGWVSLLDETFGWQGANLGCGGSGYVALGSSCEMTYDERIDQVVAADPDAVIVSGGLNDVRSTRDLNLLKKAVDKTFADLRSALPDAQIVAVSPLWSADRTPPNISILGAIVESAAAKVDGTYLDIGQPLLGRPDLMFRDGVHPNDAGHRAIASAVGEALIEVAVEPRPTGL